MLGYGRIAGLFGRMYELESYELGMILRSGSVDFHRSRKLLSMLLLNRELQEWQIESFADHHFMLFVLHYLVLA